MDIDNVLNRLSKVRKNGANKWMACCPAHDDKSPSLGIKLDTDKIVLNCFADCDKSDILSSIDLSFTDLFPPRDQLSEHRDKPNWNARGFRKVVVNKEKELQMLEAEMNIYEQMCLHGHKFTKAENEKYQQKYYQIKQLKKDN